MKSKKNAECASRHGPYPIPLNKRRVRILWGGRKDSIYRPADWTIEVLNQPAAPSAPFPSSTEYKTERPSLSAPNLTETEVIKLINQMRDEIKVKVQSEVEISEYDPENEMQNIHGWLAEVEDCGLVNSWTDEQKTQIALKKLAGRAKEWYESVPHAVHGWATWQKKLLKAFPNEQDFGQLIEDMMARTTRNGETYDTYYSDKLKLVEKCGFTNVKAVACITHGILDRNLQNISKALGNEEPEELLDFLTRQDPVRNSRQNIPRNPVVRVKVNPIFCPKCCPGGIYPGNIRFGQ